MSAARAVAVLLAAGAGRRYGGLKQLAELGGEPMLRRVVRDVLATGAPLVVVTGAHAFEVEGALAGLPLLIERHAGWADGMGSSLAAGVRRACVGFPEATGVLLCLADQPLPDVTLLERMLARHRIAPDAILATEYAGALGPPVLFPHDCFALLGTWSGPRGARTLLEREAARVERFAAPDLIDVDTPEDLARVRARRYGA